MKKEIEGMPLDWEQWLSLCQEWWKDMIGEGPGSEDLLRGFQQGAW